MLKILITCILLINSIFWGIYPPSENSPHNQIIEYLGLNIKLDYISHLVIGFIFYVLGILMGQQALT